MSYHHHHHHHQDRRRTANQHYAPRSDADDRGPYHHGRHSPTIRVDGRHDRIPHYGTYDRFQRGRDAHRLGSSDGGHDERAYAPTPDRWQNPAATTSSFNEAYVHSPPPPRGSEQGNDKITTVDQDEGPTNKRELDSSTSSGGNARRGPLAPWSLCSILDPFVLATPSETLLLQDVKHRPLSASKEMARVLTSLEDPDWPERNFRDKIAGFVTVSHNGRWFAIVACRNERTAKAMKTSMEDNVKDLTVEFIESEVIVSPQDAGSWTLHQDVLQSVVSHGALIDVCDPMKEDVAAQQTSIIEATSENNEAKPAMNKTVLQLPGNVAKDHRKFVAVPSSKKLASHISRWNAQQEEMLNADNTDEGGLGAETPVEKFASSMVTQRSVSDKDVGESEFDFTDKDKKACMLCQRQFKTLDVMRRHVVQSELHKRNLQDQPTCEAGRQRKRAGRSEDRSLANMKPAGFAPVKADNEVTEDSIAYRDRAMERRVVFGTESVSKAKSFTQKRKLNTVHDATTSQSSGSDVHRPPPAEIAKFDENSVGGALLARMGWSSGQGLGAGGEGRVAPVEAHIYAQGAGLGSHPGGVAPPTVEDQAAKRARLMHGDASLQRTERMRDRWEDGKRT